MKRKLILSAAVLSVAMLMLPALAMASDAASGPYTVRGYVEEVLPGGNAPLEAVVVTVLSDSTPYSGVTDANGFFSIWGLPVDTDLMIMFSKAGYTLRSCPHVGDENAHGYRPLDLSGLTPDSHDVYTITSNPGKMQTAQMSISYAEVTGTVLRPGGAVEGADVVLVSESTDEVYSGVTDSAGRYTILCPNGDYRMKISRNGFISSDAVHIKADGNTPLTAVELIPRSNDVFVGLNSVHILMIVSVVLGTLFSALLLFGARSKGDSIEIRDDTDLGKGSEEKKDGDQGQIRL
jgi:hypothetical protein